MAAYSKPGWGAEDVELRHSLHGYDPLDKGFQQLREAERLSGVVVNNEAKRHVQMAQMLGEHLTVMTNNGLTFRHTFFERRVGLSIALSRYGDEGREFVSVDWVNEESGVYPSLVMPSDELIAVNDRLILEPSQATFPQLLRAIASAARPITLTFIKGENRVQAFKALRETRARLAADACAVSGCSATILGEEEEELPPPPEEEEEEEERVREGPECCCVLPGTRERLVLGSFPDAVPTPGVLTVFEPFSRGGAGGRLCHLGLKDHYLCLVAKVDAQADCCAPSCEPSCESDRVVGGKSDSFVTGDAVVLQMSTKELKSFLKSVGVSTVSCLEKCDLQRLATETRASMPRASLPGMPLPTETTATTTTTTTTTPAAVAAAATFAPGVVSAIDLLQLRGVHLSRDSGRLVFASILDECEFSALDETEDTYHSEQQLALLLEDCVRRIAFFREVGRLAGLRDAAALRVQERVSTRCAHLAQLTNRPFFSHSASADEPPVTEQRFYAAREWASKKRVSAADEREAAAREWHASRAHPLALQHRAVSHSGLMHAILHSKRAQRQRQLPSPQPLPPPPLKKRAPVRERQGFDDSYPLDCFFCEPFPEHHQVPTLPVVEQPPPRTTSVRARRAHHLTEPFAADDNETCMLYSGYEPRTAKHRTVSGKVLNDPVTEEGLTDGLRLNRVLGSHPRVQNPKLYGAFPYTGGMLRGLGVV